jgi:hypothetical protein
MTKSSSCPPCPSFCFCFVCLSPLLCLLATMFRWIH